jgi:hypothetical protein
MVLYTKYQIPVKWDPFMFLIITYPPGKIYPITHLSNANIVYGCRCVWNGPIDTSLHIDH